MPGGAAPLIQMKAGKMTLENTTVTADARKGLLILRKSEDGLMHLIWKDRNAGTVVDDLIVFEGDATIRRVDECTDGFAMLLEFSQTARKLFFYSQEPRKKGSGWGADDTSKEKEMCDKANNILTGGTATAPAAAAGGGPGGALGMTHSELLAMLGGGAAAAGSAPASDATGAGGIDVSAALGALGAGAIPPGSSPASGPPASAAPASAAPATPFSADNIANILGNIGTPAGGAPAAPAAGGAFSADAISNILGNLQAARPTEPLGLGEVLHPESAGPAIDAAMEVALNEHLPQGGEIAESAAGTLSTPQMAQVSAMHHAHTSQTHCCLHTLRAALAPLALPLLAVASPMPTLGGGPLHRGPQPRRGGRSDP